jgi:predicted enzyme related to lactoylglutathione lyase
MASKFVWYELMTSDMKAAEAFYKSVVGWNSETWQGAMPYTMMKVGDTGVAGLMTIPEEAAKMGQPPAWVGYIYSDNVDKQADAIRKAGGKVHREPSDIPEIGRFAVMADPQGAVFMLFKPHGEERPMPAAGAPGTFGWRELYTTDWEKGFDFYSRQFGWEKDQAMDMGAMGTYQLFKINGEQAGGIMNKPAEVPVPSWGYYINVKEINAAADRVKSAGGKVVHGPMDVPGGSKIVQCTDPQGAFFSLVAPAS